MSIKRYKFHNIFHNDQNKFHKIFHNDQNKFHYLYVAVKVSNSFISKE